LIHNQHYNGGGIQKMTDAHLLRYIIRKNGETVDDLAAAMEMSRATLSAKMNNKREFKTSEVIS
jgi:hypothetical protein